MSSNDKKHSNRSSLKGGFYLFQLPDNISSVFPIP